MTSALRRMALHWQILIALVAGAICGLLVNPGEIKLPAYEAPVTLIGERDARTGGWVVRIDDPAGLETGRRVFQTLGRLKAQFPELAELLENSQDVVTLQERLGVTHRHAHLVEDGRTITIRYARFQQQRPVVTTIQVADAAELTEKHAAWAEFYADHGGGIRAGMTSASRYLGDLFLRLLKMITVPLIVTSLVTGVAGLGNTKRFGAMFGKTFLYYLSTSMLAIVTGILAVNVIRPGIGAELPGGSEATLLGGEQSLGQILAGLLSNMIPSNPVQALAEAHFLSIIAFSILIGIFIIYTGGRSGETLRHFFQAGFDVMMNMTLFIIRLAPIGVFAFVVFATASQGVAVFQTLGWYMVTVFVALLFHATVTLPLIVRFVGRRSPVAYARAVSPALMTAFSTASSNGTLPLTLSCVEQRAGISNRVSSFVLPLGATVNMDGTALYEAVAVLFIAQAYFGAVPLHTQIIVAVTALLASVGAAGIPHAGLVMMAIVLQAVHLPMEAQGLIIAVDRVLDMCRTSVNVWSDSCGCAILARLDAEE